VSEPIKKIEIKIPIPESLKFNLVEDWENITKDKKVLIYENFNNLIIYNTIKIIINDFIITIIFFNSWYHYLESQQ